MASLHDYVDRLALNQHGGIMGYIRMPDGRIEGPRPLDIFLVHGRITCADLERLGGAHADIDPDLGFRGEIVELDGPLRRALACGAMLIGLAD